MIVNEIELCLKILSLKNCQRIVKVVLGWAKRNATNAPVQRRQNKLQPS